jgi:hypothetical protein
MMARGLECRTFLGGSSPVSPGGAARPESLVGRPAGEAQFSGRKSDDPLSLPSIKLAGKEKWAAWGEFAFSADFRLLTVHFTA